MGFFEDVGRSGEIGRQTQRLSDLVRGLRRDRAEEEERKFNRGVTNRELEIKEQTAAGNQAIQSERLEALRRRNEEAERELAAQKRMVSLKAMIPGGDPNAFPRTTKMMQQIGRTIRDQNGEPIVKNVEGELMVEARDLKRIQDMMQTNAEFRFNMSTMLDKAALADVEANKRKVQQALQSGEVKGKDKEALQQQFQALEQQSVMLRNSLVNVDAAHQRELQKIQAQAEAKAATGGNGPASTLGKEVLDMARIKGIPIEQALEEKLHMDNAPELTDDAIQLYRFYLGPDGGGLSKEEALEQTAADVNKLKGQFSKGIDNPEDPFGLGGDDGEF